MTDMKSPAASSFEEDLARFADLMASGGGAHPSRPRREAPYAAPMSYAQEVIWLLDRATPGLTAYNMPVARRIVGALDLAALQHALDTLVARHDALRTRLAEIDGEPRQIVDAAAPVIINRVNLSSVPDAKRESRARDIVRERARTPFDLAHEPLFRVTLVTLGPTDHVLVLELHHATIDGWSIGIVLRELAAAYAAQMGAAGQTSGDAAMQLAHFAEEQRAALAGGRLDALLEFWRGHIGDASEPLSLPTDFVRPNTPSFEGARESALVPAELLAAVRELARSHNATVYMVLLAAYGLVLHRYTGRDDVLIGSGSAGRTTPELEGLVGYVNNTVVQRVSFGGDPALDDLLDRIRDGALGVYDHQDMPLEKLALDLRGGDASRAGAPLFEVVLTMQDTGQQRVDLGDATVEPFAADLGATKFDLTLLASERGEGLSLVAQYRTELFTPERIRRFLGHIVAVLHAAVATPRLRASEVDILTPAERATLQQAERGPAIDPSSATIIDMVRAAADANPHGVAIVGDDASMTYAELVATSNRIARELTRMGVQRGDRVGLALDRSADAIIALLGIMAAGAAWVPLPDDIPAAYIVDRIAAAGIRFAVARGHSMQLPADTAVLRLDDDAARIAAHPASAPAESPYRDDVAYVLYTSGSTGVPKGVGVTHANLTHYTRAITPVLVAAAAAAPAESMSAWHSGVVSSLGADLGHTALFPVLAAGGTVHVLSRRVATEPAAFAAYVTAHPLDLLKITPSHLRALLGERAGAALASVLPRRVLVTGGEALDFALARSVLDAHSCALLNHYGPTETTVGATTFYATDASLMAAQACSAQTVPIGTPLAGETAAVHDIHGARAPLGIPGELWIAGPGVAGAGYVGDPVRTAERFALLPEIDGAAARQRAYRTGDRVRWLTLPSEASGAGPSAALEFLGRADQQVKVRGYRLELGEVEAVLSRHPEVAQAVAAVRIPEGSDEGVLVAYVIARPAGTYTEAPAAAGMPLDARVVAWASERLPSYMVPGACVVLERMPLTRNGKIDRAALPDPSGRSTADEATSVAPRTATEQKIAAIWSEVLKRDAVGVNQRFMNLGGHSLLAIRVLGKLSREFGIRLPLRALFDAPTIEELAVVVDAEVARGGAKPPAGITARPRQTFRAAPSTSPAPGDISK